MYVDLYILDEFNFGKYLYMKVEVELWMYKVISWVNNFMIYRECYIFFKMLFFVLVNELEFIF